MNPELERPGWTARTDKTAVSADGGTIKVGDSPVEVVIPKSALGGDGEIRVDVLEAAVARSVSPFGAAIEVEFSDAEARLVKPSAAYDITIDFSDVALSQFGLSVSRLRLVWQTGCSVVEVKGGEDGEQLASELHCDYRAVVPAEIDPVARTLTATIDEAALAAETDAGRLEASLLDGPILAQGAAVPFGTSSVLSLGASAGSSNGNYRPTEAASLLSYQVGLHTGSADLTYVVPVPDAAAGPSPSVVLRYSSSSIDGMHTSVNAQPGAVGVGWTFNPGSIVRRTDPDCASSNAMCRVSGDEFTMTLNGVGGLLVETSTANSFVLQSDPRYRIIRHASGNGGPADVDEWWEVTTPDGTVYRFGGHTETETGAVQNSVAWSNFYDTSSSFCGSYSYDICRLTYEWKLDRVVDTNGNVMSYFYEQEINWYDPPSGSIGSKNYVRATHLERIEYGKREGSSTHPNARVDFGWENRCGNTTTFGACQNDVDYPDTPWDQLCYTATCSNESQAFFSQLRLSGIHTQVRQGTSTTEWYTLGSFDLAQNFHTPLADPEGDPDPSEAKLLLYRIHQRPGGNYQHMGYEQTEAEDYDSQSGTTGGTPTDVGLGGKAVLTFGDEINFTDVRIFTAEKVYMRAWTSSSDVDVNIFLDGSSTPWTTVNMTNSGWTTFESPSGLAASGVKDITIKLASGGHTVHLNWFRIAPDNMSTVADLGQATDYYSGAFTWLRNREDSGGSSANGISPSMMARIKTVTNEFGGEVTFNLSTHRTGQSNTFLDCQGSNWPATWWGSDNDTLCFPEEDPFYNQGVASIWRRHVVLSMTADDSSFTGNASQTVDYVYDSPRHHLTNLPRGTEYHSDFRGFEKVTVEDPLGDTEHRFFQGMDENKEGSATPNYYVYDSDGTQYEDHNWLAGQTLESRRLTSGGTRLSRTLSEFYWTRNAGSSSDIYAAYFVAPDDIENRLYTNSGSTSGGDPGVATSVFTYDSYGNVTVATHTGTGGPARTIQRAFVANTSEWITSLPRWQKLWAGTSPGTLGNEVTLTEFEYDNQSMWIAPVKGNMTEVRARKIQPTTTVSTHYVYDAQGRVTKVTDPLGNDTTTVYDSSHGQPTSTTNELGHTTSFEYNSYRWLVRVIDPNSSSSNDVITHLSYDTYGRMRKVWLPTEDKNAGVDPTMEYTYQWQSEPARTTTYQMVFLKSSGVGSDMISYGYVDGFGRPLQTQTTYRDEDEVQNTRRIVATKYDTSGNVQYQSSAFSNTAGSGSSYFNPNWNTVPNYTHYVYDERGKVEFERTKSSGTTLFESTFLNNGRTVRAYDANDNKTVWRNDMFGNLELANEYNDAGTQVGSASYDYDVANRLTDLTYEGQTIEIEYDLLGRKTELDDPDAGLWTYTYDDSSNMKTQTDPNSQTLWFGYDDLHRMVERRDTNAGGSLLAAWAWDPAGQVGSLASSTAYDSAEVAEVTVTNETFDSQHRPTRVAYAIAGAGTFDMRTSFRPTGDHLTLRYPSNNTGGIGESITFSRTNATGELAAVKSSLYADDYISDVDYHQSGQIESMVHNTHSNRWWSYSDANLRVVDSGAGVGTGSSNIEHKPFQYDNVGNITRIRDYRNSSQYQCFEYDHRNRLIEAFTTDTNACSSPNPSHGQGGYDHDYTYHDDGRIKSTTDLGIYTYGDANHPDAVTAAGGHAFAYDAAGNMRVRNLNPGTSQTLVYNEENRVESITQGSSVTEFLYTADGDRVARIDDGTLNVQIHGLFEWTAADGFVYYYSAGGHTIAMRDSDGLHYLYGDQIGSTSSVRTAAGSTVRQRYYPFGGIRSVSGGTTPTEYGFTGQRLDPTGLMDYRARQYDPLLGRFAQPDTIIPNAANPQDFGRYTYVRNSPVAHNDPSGHSPDSVSIVGGNGVGTDCLSGRCEGEKTIGTRTRNPNTWRRLPLPGPAFWFNSNSYCADCQRTVVVLHLETGAYTIGALAGYQDLAFSTMLVYEESVFLSFADRARHADPYQIRDGLVARRAFSGLTTGVFVLYEGVLVQLSADDLATAVTRAGETESMADEVRSYVSRRGWFLATTRGVSGFAGGALSSLAATSGARPLCRGNRYCQGAAFLAGGFVTSEVAVGIADSFTRDAHFGTMLEGIEIQFNAPTG